MYDFNTPKLPLQHLNRTNSKRDDVIHLDEHL